MLDDVARVVWVDSAVRVVDVVGGDSEGEARQLVRERVAGVELVGGTSRGGAAASI